MTMDLKVIPPEDADRVIIAGQEESTDEGGKDETAEVSGVLEIAGNLDLAEAAKSFSVLDIFSQEKIEGLLRVLFAPKEE